jgi:hypothetical protein
VVRSSRPQRKVSKDYEIQIMRKESGEAYQKSCLVDQRMGGRYSGPLCGEWFPMNTRFTNSSDRAAAWKHMLRMLLIVNPGRPTFSYAGARSGRDGVAIPGVTRQPHGSSTQISCGSHAFPGWVSRIFTCFEVQKDTLDSKKMFWNLPTNTKCKLSITYRLPAVA